MIYKVVVISAVQHSDSVIHIYTFILFQILFPHSQPTLGRVPCAIQPIPIGQSFHIPQCAYASPKPPVHPSHSSPVSFGNHKFVKVFESVSVLQISSFVSFSTIPYAMMSYDHFDVCLSLSD